MADQTPRIRVQCTLEMPETLLLPFLHLIRAWEAGEQDVRVQIASTPVSYTTEELAAFLRTLDPPLAQITTRPRED